MELTNRRRSREQWQALVEQFSTSSLPQAQFCEQHGLLEKTFYNWRLRLNRESQSSAFVPVTTESKALSVDPGQDIVVHCGDVTIHLPLSLGMTATGELVRALRDVE